MIPIVPVLFEVYYLTTCVHLVTYLTPPQLEELRTSAHTLQTVPTSGPLFDVTPLDRLPAEMTGVRLEHLTQHAPKVRRVLLDLLEAQGIDPTDIYSWSTYRNELTIERLCPVLPTHWMQECLRNPQHRDRDAAPWDWPCRTHEVITLTTSLAE